MTNFLSRAAIVAMVVFAGSAGATLQHGATHHAKKKAPARKSTSASTSKGAASSSKRGMKTSTKRSATTWRNRQMSPSTDRYREIQLALASKGYLKTEDATGGWNAASVDALKHFQSEQNLEANGKINSLSLLALGLGPKREPVALAAPAKPPQDADHTPR